MSWRLGLSVTLADGTVRRWGADEPNGEDIPADLTFSTSIPGGFRDLSCSLPRRVTKDYPDEQLFSGIRVYDAGAGNTVWEGRMAALPRQHGDSFGVTPSAVGWAAHLKDDKSKRWLFRDIDLGQWGGPSVQRQINMLAVSLDLTAGTQTPDDATGDPSVALEIRSPWSRAAQSEAWYRSPLAIGSVAYEGKADFAMASDADWSLNLYTADDDTAAGLAGTSDLAGSNTWGPATHTASSGHKAAYIRLNYPNAVTSDSNIARRAHWTHLAVMGTHGLTLRGTEPDAGYYVSDLIDHIVSTGAPLLTRDIDTNTTVVPHATFLDPTTAEDALSTINAYALWEWGVWENKTFFFRQPDADRLTWRARLSEGAGLDLEGETADTALNGVVVSYRDASGKQKTVGPTGASTDDTSTDLEDTTSTNPVNAAGIPRRWDVLNVSVPTTLSGATTLGRIYLSERLTAARRGTITLQGTVRHPTKGERPVWEVRAGDHILIEDRPGDVTRRIVSTRYSHATRSLVAECDNTAARLEAIIARLGIWQTGQGF